MKNVDLFNTLSKAKFYSAITVTYKENNLNSSIFAFQANLSYLYGFNII